MLEVMNWTFWEDDRLSPELLTTHPPPSLKSLMLSNQHKEPPPNEFSEDVLGWLIRPRSGYSLEKLCITNDGAPNPDNVYDIEDRFTTAFRHVWPVIEELHLDLSDADLRDFFEVDLPRCASLRRLKLRNWFPGLDIVWLPRSLETFGFDRFDKSDFSALCQLLRANRDRCPGLRRIMTTTYYGFNRSSSVNYESDDSEGVLLRERRRSEHEDATTLRNEFGIDFLTTHVG